MNYTESDVLRLGKRHHNTKRQYLLINPLQAKHIPVSPSQAYEMMCALGQKLYEAFPETDCIIGFAETATAIAECVALNFPKSVFYIQTTREPIDGEKISFLEEHSHAVDQSLIISRLKNRDIHHVLLIDDEISTGKTVLNIINELKKNIFPENCTFSVGSIINRMHDDTRKQFQKMGIRFAELVHVRNQDFESTVQPIAIHSPKEIEQHFTSVWFESSMIPHKNPRTGIHYKILRKKDQIHYISGMYESLLEKAVPLTGKILVLGTEECMFPAILLGRMIEKNHPNTAVFTHSTTRSPIGISHETGYPIQNGYKINSFYEEGRNTYLYQIGNYNTVIVVTDSQNQEQIQKAMNDIVSLFQGNALFFLIAGEGNT